MRFIAAMLLVLCTGGMAAAPVEPSSRFQLLEATDATFTFREQLPSRVALDEPRYQYHREGCPLITPDMPWVTPAEAKYRGTRQHLGCVTFPLAKSATRTVNREPRDPRHLRVLFIGSSVTYYNEMPQLLKLMSARESRPLEVEQVASGEMSLDQHWGDGEALRKIWASHWDFVVLQERSSVAPIDQYADFSTWVSLFVDHVRKSGARPLLVMNYDIHHRRADLTAAFERVAAAVPVPLVPVANAWYDLTDRHIIERLDVDSFHPNIAGSYLIACELYSMIYGKPPNGLPFTFEGFEKTGDRYRASLEEDALTAEGARALQLAAWSAVSASQRSDAVAVK